MSSSHLSLAAAAWLVRPQTVALLDLLNGDGALTRAVGGCVRDTLLGQATGETEVDLATSLTPDAVSARLEAADIRVVPTGLAHGTVSAIMPGGEGQAMVYEITTLRQDVETDGRHAQIAFSDSWESDAARRDLTINALYCDGDGTVHDPNGQGLADIEARHIRFIGPADQRIAEDYLRVLRFFRFHFTLAPEASLDGAARQACQAAAGHMHTLSGERKQSEILKILALPDAAAALQAMQGCGLLQPIFGVETTFDLARLSHLAAAGEDGILRFASLFDDAAVAQQAAQCLRFSNADEKRVVAALTPSAHVQRQDMTGALYYDGVARLADQAALAPREASSEADFWQALQARLDAYERPVFPLNGAKLKQAGVPEGPEMGRILAQLESWWVANDFPPEDALAAALAAQLKQAEIAPK
jgi:poly(A) polymerase